MLRSNDLDRIVRADLPFRTVQNFARNFSDVHLTQIGLAYISKNVASVDQVTSKCLLFCCFQQYNSSFQIAFQTPRRFSINKTFLLPLKTQITKSARIILSCQSQFRREMSFSNGESKLISSSTGKSQSPSSSIQLRQIKPISSRTNWIVSFFKRTQDVCAVNQNYCTFCTIDVIRNVQPSQLTRVHFFRANILRKNKLVR